MYIFTVDLVSLLIRINWNLKCRSWQGLRDKNVFRNCRLNHSFYQWNNISKCNNSLELYYLRSGADQMDKDGSRELKWEKIPFSWFIFSCYVNFITFFILFWDMWKVNIYFVEYVSNESILLCFYFRLLYVQESSTPFT
mgnify:CR=1 FL=1